MRARWRRAVLRGVRMGHTKLNLRREGRGTGRGYLLGKNGEEIGLFPAIERASVKRVFYMVSLGLGVFSFVALIGAGVMIGAAAVVQISTPAKADCWMRVGAVTGNGGVVGVALASLVYAISNKLDDDPTPLLMVLRRAARRGGSKA